VEQAGKLHGCDRALLEKLRALTVAQPASDAAE
jgi:hypothetical protein